jgi:uncharacterized RDD family membrane protein YckC
MSITPTFPATADRAALWRRLAAFGYDLLLVLALLMVITALVLAARGGEAFDARSIWFRSLLLTGWWAYFAWSWTHGGQTVGMRAWRLVLTTSDGGPVGLGTATLRYLAAWLAATCAGLGYLWCLVDRQGLCWHDRLSQTVISRVPRLAKPDHVNQRH